MPDVITTDPQRQYNRAYRSPDQEPLHLLVSEWQNLVRSGKAICAMFHVAYLTLHRPGRSPSSSMADQNRFSLSAHEHSVRSVFIWS